MAVKVKGIQIVTESGGCFIKVFISENLYIHLLKLGHTMCNLLFFVCL